MKMLKFVADSLARKMGYEVISQWRKPLLEFTEHLQAIFALRNIDCVLDVGANRGQYRDFLRTHVGYCGWIISFEPVRKNVELLRRRTETDPKWRVFDCALGSSESLLNMNVMKMDIYSSFLQPNMNADPMFKAGNAVDHVEQVRVRRLDSVLAEAIDATSAQNVYLKLDTQGFDLEVVAGASGILDRIEGLQTEVAVQQIYESMPDYFTSIRALNEKGFDVTGLFPVTRDKDLRVVEFDCVMINRNRITGVNGMA